MDVPKPKILTKVSHLLDFNIGAIENVFIKDNVSLVNRWSSNRGSGVHLCKIVIM